jgi:hypothetical protein
MTIVNVEINKSETFGKIEDKDSFGTDVEEDDRGFEDFGKMYKHEQ